MRPVALDRDLPQILNQSARPDLNRRPFRPRRFQRRSGSVLRSPRRRPREGVVSLSVRKGPSVGFVAALIGVGIALALISGDTPPSDEQSPGASSSDQMPVAVSLLLGSRFDQVTDVRCVETPRPEFGRHNTLVLPRPLRRLTGLRGTVALAEAPTVRCRIELANGRKLTFVKGRSRWSRVPPGVIR
jgi:hypothetical protein